MAVKINVPVSGSKSRTVMQLSLIHAMMCAKRTKEVKVLSYMVRHNSGGVYVVKRNYRIDIAKAIGSTPVSVRDILQSLQKKKVIKFMNNEQGNNLGVYSFAPAVEAVCKQSEDLIFHFINK